MKYYSPLPPCIFDTFCEDNDLNGLTKYTLEKLTQLDNIMLLNLSTKQLGKLYNMSRQTITSHINSLLAQNIILDTNIGKIVCLPTYTGFFGTFYSVVENFYKFVLTLPNTNIQYFVDIFRDDFVRDLSKNLVLGQCYYFFANIRIPSDYPVSTKQKFFDLHSSGTNCTEVHHIENIGYQINKNSEFVKIATQTTKKKK